MTLRGLRVLVTRPRDQATDLVMAFEARGARVLALPTIGIAPPEEWGTLDAALSQLAGFDWVAVTSANGARAVLERLARLAADSGDLHLPRQSSMVISPEEPDRSHPPSIPPSRGETMIGSASIDCSGIPAGPRWAAVGFQTAAALEAGGIRPALVAEPPNARGLLSQLVATGIQGARVLVPQSDRARPTLVEGLRAAGAEVVAPVAYRTLGVEPAIAQELQRVLRQGGVDWIILASPSSWQELLHAAGPLPEGVRLAAIGPTTTAAIRDTGYQVACEAPVPTADALAAAVAQVVSEDP